MYLSGTYTGVITSRYRTPIIDRLVKEFIVFIAQTMDHSKYKIFCDMSGSGNGWVFKFCVAGLKAVNFVTSKK